jgi:hypothetical protein
MANKKRIGLDLALTIVLDLVERGVKVRELVGDCEVKARLMPKTPF